MTSADPASEIVRLRRRVAIWTWVAVAGVILTAWAWFGKPAHHPGTPAATSHETAAGPSVQSPAVPAIRMDSASRSPEPFNIPAVTDMGDDTFSPLLVQRRFAGVCPDVQVIPLPRGATTVVQLSSFLPVAMVGQIYAPGPVAGCRTMIAYISMTRDDAGTGTTVRTDWSCAIRLRPGSDSGALDGLFLPYDMKELFSTDEFSRHRIALRDVVKLCSGVRP